jgi:hypothetical protein
LRQLCFCSPHVNYHHLGVLQCAHPACKHDHLHRVHMCDIKSWRFAACGCSMGGRLRVHSTWQHGVRRSLQWQTMWPRCATFWGHLRLSAATTVLEQPTTDPPHVATRVHPTGARQRWHPCSALSWSRPLNQNQPHTRHAAARCASPPPHSSLCRPSACRGLVSSSPAGASQEFRRG